MENPDKAESALRRWVSNIGLLLTALVFLGDLIAFVTSLLLGELTTRFALRCLVVIRIGWSGIPLLQPGAEEVARASADHVASSVCGMRRVGHGADARVRILVDWIAFERASAGSLRLEGAIRKQKIRRWFAGASGKSGRCRISRKGPFHRPALRIPQAGWRALSGVRGVQGGKPLGFRPGAVLGASGRTKVF